MRGNQNYQMGEQGKISQCKGEGSTGLSTNANTGLMIQIDQGLFHKSAPLSPRQNPNTNYSNKRNSDNFGHEASP